MKTTITFNQEVKSPDISDMPRYVIEAQYANGETYWRYNPPQKAVDAGVVERCVLGTDRVSAWQKADDFNAVLDEWLLNDKSIAKVDGMNNAPTVDGLCQEFFDSRFYTTLNEKTRYDYKSFLRRMRNTQVKGKELGHWYFKEVTRAVAEEAYTQWAAQGPHYAEHIRSAARRVWNLGEKWELLYANPWKHVEPVKLPHRNTTWSHDQLKKFLETAFSRHEWANVGMIVLLAYELGQRLGDMRTLEWSEYIQHKGVFEFTQSKRGVDMQLPVSEALTETLHNQYQKFGESKYIAPHPRSLEPYNSTLLSKTGQRIREAAGLPKELRLMDMRRTAVSEAADGGATMAELMAMTGHQNTASIKPYLRKSAKQAGAALSKRAAFMTNTVDKTYSVKSSD